LPVAAGRWPRIPGLQRRPPVRVGADHHRDWRWKTLPTNPIACRMAAARGRPPQPVGSITTAPRPPVEARPAFGAGTPGTS